MDERIFNIIEKESVVEPEFFIQNRTLYKLWKRVFRGQYETSNDTFKQAFCFMFGHDVMTWQRVEYIHRMAASQDITPDLLNLIDLINLTDFISISDACSLFEVDSLKLCDAAVRQENAKNYEFEFR